ncbi:hypothetical protein BCR33DRAFT_784780 [Rhizoclosmatium globosum]|uniref:Nucleotide-diphospho-sugar transferase domain-containing protein n=1 Tax=Rhizoclosmatium globosum TaxID=329046 RepID=A0A1Y2CCZ8_9FUNG|nr:hypothetical protein BCR33DRAFT_784780 [Rhizoclosmatium globosum]|eukprot:ORY44694.1 hypothetical protein BCR33DRAFT_784780 [Rhizoclosmatium globosum]
MIKKLYCRRLLYDPLTYKPETPFNEPLNDTATDAWNRLYSTCTAVTQKTCHDAQSQTFITACTGRHEIQVPSLRQFEKRDELCSRSPCISMDSSLTWRAIKDFNLILVPSRHANQVFQHTVNVPEHQSDVLRMEIATIYGGIYSDFDVFCTRRDGREEPSDGVYGGTGNGILINKRCARFMVDWYKFYVTFRDGEWREHSVELPHMLWKTLAKPGGGPSQELIHVELGTMQNPNFLERHLIHTAAGLSGWDWSKNIACHLFVRHYGGRDGLNFESVKTVEDPIGRMARYILWGDKTKPFMIGNSYAAPNDTDKKVE